MAKPVLGLGVEIASDEIRLALVESGQKGYTVRSLQTVKVTEDLTRVFRGFQRRPGAVVTAVPLEQAAIRILDLPPTTDENLERVVALEAETALPLTSDELALSHHVLGLTEQSRMEVLLAAARLTAVKDLLERVNCAPWVSATVTVTPVALINGLERLGGVAREEPLAVLRIEAHETELLVADRHRIAVAQTIPVGCHAAAPAPALAVAGGGPGESAAAWTTQLSQQVRYALQALSYERGIAVQRLWLCGRGAAALGAIEALEEQVGLPVRLAAPAEGGSDEARYSVAYGCAVQAAGGASMALNLTPARLAVAREVEQRRQTRFSWGALVGAVVLSGALIFGAAVHNRRQTLALLQGRLQEIGPAARQPVGASPKEVKAAADAVGETLDMRVSAAGALSTMSRSLPSGTWLAELSYNSETGCVLRGFSRDGSGPRQAQVGLLRQALFDEVTLDYQTQELIGTTPVWGFQLTCKIRPKEDRRRRRGGAAPQR